MLYFCEEYSCAESRVECYNFMKEYSCVESRVECCNLVRSIAVLRVESNVKIL
jgi:hypothetical protein